MPKHMTTSLQIIPTWLNIVTAVLKQLSSPEAVSTYFSCPDFFCWVSQALHFLVGPEARGHSDRQVLKSSWNAAAVRSGINREVHVLSLLPNSKSGRWISAMSHGQMTLTWYLKLL